MSETAVREPNLTASRDAPLGGQAVLEGVMMRGVKHWSVAVRTPAAEDAPEGTLGEIAVQEFEFGERPRLRKFARIPVLRGVIALVESLAIGFKALSIAASAQLGEEAEELPGRHLGRRVAGRRLRLRDRPVLRRPGDAGQPDQAPARLLDPLLAGRGRRADRDLPRLPDPALAHARPAPHVRVPRRRAQDDLLLRGRRRAHARARGAVLAPAPALRHQLPARRDDRLDLRLRDRRPARLVDPRGHAHRRPADHHRRVLRADQVGGTQPRARAGSRS